jgi:hypothetical protein
MRKEIHIAFVGRSNEEQKKMRDFNHDLKNCCREEKKKIRV